MKKLGLILVFLICFGAFDGYCNGNKQRLIRIENQVDTISGGIKVIDDHLVVIENKVDTISGGIKVIDDHLVVIEGKINATPTPPPTPTSTRPPLVPISMEIINAVKANGLDFGNLGYYLSIPLILATNNQNNNGTTIDANGDFILKENNSSSELRISTDDKGTLGNYSTSGKEKFEILFSITNPDRTVKLTFERNEQKNSFDLAYAEDAGRAYVISTNKGDPVPQLSIRYAYIIDNPPPPNGIVAVQGIPAAQAAEPDIKTADTQRDQRDITIVRIENVNVQQSDLRVSVPTPTPSPSRETSNAIRIEGRGSLQKNTIVNYILSQNPAASRTEVRNLIDTYIREAQREGINYDIAVAQMCYATNFYRDRQLINTYNYAGFGAIKGIPVTYRNMDEGVRAHIQHLKGYATTARPQGTVVDKRYDMLGTIKGTVKTLDTLFAVWAPNNAKDYGDGINRILRGLGI